MTLRQIDTPYARSAGELHTVRRRFPVFTRSTRRGSPAGGQSGHDRAVQSGPEQVAGVSARALSQYKRARDFPADGTSRCPRLCISGRSIRTILAEIPDPLTDPFARQLAWREFYADVLWHRPEAVWTSLDERFDTQMEYANLEDPVTAAQYEAWTPGPHRVSLRGRRHASVADQAGCTTDCGWSASFLIKTCTCRGSWGPGGFLRHLVDADVNQLRLAVGRRLRHGRCAIFPDLQPGHPKVAASTPTATTSGGTFRNSPMSLDPHEPGCSPRTTLSIVDHRVERDVASRVSRRWALAHRPSEQGRIPAPDRTR